MTAMVDELAEAFALEPAGEGRWRARSLAEVGEGNVVFGGQLAAQMLIAGASADPAKTVKSLQVIFGRAAIRTEMMELEVEAMHGGRSFASATVSAFQGGRLCSRALVLLSAEEPDVIRHAAPMPAVDGPDDCPNWDAYEVGGSRIWVAGREQRVVGGLDTSNPAQTRDAELFAWTRMRGAGDDPVRSQAFAAFATAGPNIGVAMLPHDGIATSSAHTTVSTGIMTHNLVFHDAFHAGGWLLLAFESPSAGHGRSFGRGDVFTEDGRLVASFFQSNMIRHFRAEGVSVGAGRTVL
jgi:acyl-CoA thioesterase